MQDLLVLIATSMCDFANTQFFYLTECSCKMVWVLLSAAYTQLITSQIISDSTWLWHELILGQPTFRSETTVVEKSRQKIIYFFNSFNWDTS